jgi:Zn finger protein HypA/HybF involved in hydrogenase expression
LPYSEVVCVECVAGDRPDCSHHENFAALMWLAGQRGVSEAVEGPDDLLRLCPDCHGQRSVVVDGRRVFCTHVNARPVAVVGPRGRVAARDSSTGDG